MQIPDIQDWGLIDYDKALAKQEALVQEIAGVKPGVLVFCTHPPTVTVGRKTEKDDVFNWQGPLFEISRGGRATYHGPSQIVAYPIWNLDYPAPDGAAGWPRRDIHFYLRALEKMLVDVVAEYGIEASGKSGLATLPTNTEETGLWVDGKKLGSIGIGVRKWVAFHGIALNVDHDPQAFQGINPCGFSRETMVSMEELLLGRKLDRRLLQRQIAENFQKIFS